MSRSEKTNLFPEENPRGSQMQEPLGDEFRILMQNCLRIAEDHKNLFNTTPLTWEVCYFKKISPLPEFIPPYEREFWTEANPYYELDVLWEIQLSRKSFWSIYNMKKNQHQAISVLVELVLGKFTILDFCNLYCQISCRDFGFHLIPIVVLAMKNHLSLQILVFEPENPTPDRKASIQNYLENMLSGQQIPSDTEIKCANFQELIVYDNSRLKPVGLHIGRMEIEPNAQIKVERMEFMSESAVGRGFEEKIKGGEQSTNILRNADEFQEEEKKAKESVKQIQYHRKLGISFGDLRKREEVNIYPKYRVHIKGSEVNLASRAEELKDLEKLSETNFRVQGQRNESFNILQKNCETFLSNYNRLKTDRYPEFTDWTSIILFWHQLDGEENKLIKLQHFKEFSPYTDIQGINWEISIDRHFLKGLEKRNYEEKMVYLNKILQSSQGFIIGKIENFYSHNEGAKDHLIVFDDVLNYSLPTLTIVFYITENKGTSQLKHKLNAYSDLLIDNEPIATSDRYTNPRDKLNFTEIIAKRYLRGGITDLVLTIGNQTLMPIIPISSHANCLGQLRIFLIYKSKENVAFYLQTNFRENRTRVQFRKTDMNIQEFTENKISIYECNLNYYQPEIPRIIEMTSSYLHFGTSSFSDSNARFIKESPLQFLFNVNPAPNYSNLVYTDPPGESVLDPFEQLYIYLKYSLSFPDFPTIFPIIISNFYTDIANYENVKDYSQIRIIHLLSAFISNNKEPMSPEQIHCMLGVFGLIPSPRVLSQNIPIDQIIELFRKNFWEILMYWKRLDNFNQVMKGVKLFLYKYRLKNPEDFYCIIDKIKDYSMLYEVLLFIVENLKANNKVIEIAEIWRIQEHFLNFCDRWKIKISETILANLQDINEMLAFIRRLDEQRISIGNEFLKKAFSKSLNTYTYKPDEIFYILTEIESLDKRLERCINPQEYSQFVSKNLIDSRQINENSIKTYCKIFESLERNNQHRSISYEKIICLFLNKLNPSAIKPLLHFYPNELLNFFTIWLSQLTIQELSSKMPEIDQELNQWEPDIRIQMCASVISHIFQKNSGLNEEFILVINKCRTLELKELFKNQFFEKNAGPKAENVSTRLLNFRKKNKDCEVLNQLIQLLIDSTTPSEEMIKEQILIKPSKSHNWYKHISQGKKVKTKLKKRLREYINSLVEKIITKTMPVFDMKYLSDHNQETKEAFIAYINAAKVAKNAHISTEVESNLKTIIKKYNRLVVDIKALSDLFQNFCRGIDEFDEIIAIFVDFKERYNEMTIGSFEYPEILEPYRKLTWKIHPVVNSKIFKYYFTENLSIFKEHSEVQEESKDPEVIEVVEDQQESNPFLAISNIEVEKPLFVFGESRALSKSQKFESNPDVNTERFPFRLNNQNFVEFTLDSFEKMKDDLEKRLVRIEKENIARFTLLAIEFDEEIIEEEIAVLNRVIQNCNQNIQILKSFFKALLIFEDIYPLCRSILTSYRTIHLVDGELMARCYHFVEYEQFKNFSTILEFIGETNRIQQSLLPTNLNIDWYRLTAFFNNVASSMEVLEFCNKLGQEDLDHLQEGVSENREMTLINTQNVLNFISIWSFFAEFRDQAYNYTNYVDAVDRKLNEAKYYRIFECLEDSRYHIKPLIELQSSLNFQEEAKKKKIKEIYQSSIAQLLYRKECKEKFEVRICILKNNEEIYIDGMDELIELRDRASLSAYITNSKSDAQDNAEDLEIFNKFIELINTICSTLKNINYLHMSCFRKQITLNPEFRCENGEFTDLKDFEISISNKTTFWENSKKEALEHSYWLNFLCGKHFYTVEKFMQEPSPKNIRKILPLLKFMNKLPPANLQKIPLPDDPSAKLFEISNFLENLPSPHEPYSDQHPSHFHPIIPNDNCSILLCETTYFYKGILSMYINTYHCIPKVDQVFFCNLATDWEELNIFLNRCFLNGASLYTLVNPELLPLEKQMKFKIRFHELLESHGKNRFHLGIVTEDIKSHLVNHFRYQSDVKIETFLKHQFLEKEGIKKIIQEIDGRTQVFTSKYVGLGKTTKIRRHAGENIPYIEVNISGNSDNSSLGRVLMELQPDTPVNLHLQLNSLEDTTSVHELIFSLSVFKQYYCTKGMFYLPEGSKIFIEVANTFDDFLYKSLNFLKLLPRDHITEFDINKIKPSEKILYVCNYLKSYKKQSISFEDFNFPGKVFEILSLSEIRALLESYFLPNCDNNPSFHQLTVFVNVLASLFQNLENSSYSAEVIQIMKSDMAQLSNSAICASYDQLRPSIIESLLETTKEFTSKCLQSVRDNQVQSMKKMNKSEVEMGEVPYLTSIAWENSNHFTMLFLPGGDSLCIYRNHEMVPDSIKEFLVTQKFIEESVRQGAIPGFTQRLNERLADKNQYIDNYDRLTSAELIEKLVSFYARYSMKRFEGQGNYNELKRNRIHELDDCGYILTPDNFLKMNLIYTRCISSIPLIIMGETGCGKTSLIRFFVREILHEELIILCIHSGITSDYINTKMEQINTQAIEAPDRRIWVFFDEFNTSDCIGMLCDILCERKVRNLDLQPNIIFVGACNPYRVKSSSNTYIEDVGIKKISKSHSKNSKLVHIVKPLPEKAVEYVWDFGVLKRNEIKQYVRSMLSSKKCEHEELLNSLILASHDFFQQNEDVSSVSLRDVSRFIVLYQWFRQSVFIRNENPPETNFSQYYKYKARLILMDPSLIAGILSLFHCYFLRISSRDQRRIYLDMISDCLQSEHPEVPLTQKDITNILKYEQYDYLARMKISDGTALNLALRENIFAIIPCVLNKIPILICGKPGCSKSLAIQLITSNLRGDKSHDKYFKTLPELQIISFQGSDSCTSEGITQVFERAERLLENKYLLPVVVFDEIGLAEISKHNPLKVLHGLLENENKKVGFIGISNWRLDASKMNRTLYLARPDPDQNDLIRTAVSIFSSISGEGHIEIYEPVVKIIAESYFELKEYFRNSPFADFYGLRDFYHLIKQVSKKISENPDLPREEIAIFVRRGIERNFGGKIKGVEIMWRIFSGKFFGDNPLPVQIQTTPVLDLIMENLSEKDSRYLMIIARKDVAVYLIDKCLPGDYRVLLGSKFEGDVNKEDAGFRTLSDIIRYMERGISIVLHDMDCAYSSLYDLFNQNFSKSRADRKFCRIALGAQFNPRCFVHEDFKAIVFIDQDDESLKTVDAPFLNRFEKHYIELKQIVEVQQEAIVNLLSGWVENIIKIDGKTIALNSVCIFPCYSKEALYLLVLYNNNPQEIDNEKLLENCKIELLRGASVDVVILNKLSSHTSEEKDFVTRNWEEIHRLNFIKTLESIMNEEFGGNQMIGVTYDPQSIDSELKKGFGSAVALQKISNFKSEEDANKDLQTFFNSEQNQTYILEMEYSKESDHLRLIISIIERIGRETENRWNKRKNVMILVRMSRNDQNRKPVEVFRQWKLRFFESLLGNSLELTGEILDYDLTTILHEKNIISFKEMVPDLAEKSLDSLRYQSYLYKNKEINEFKNKIEETLVNYPPIRKLFKRKIYEAVDKLGKFRTDKWSKKIFLDKGIILDAKSAKDGLKIYAESFLQKEFTKLVFLIEKRSAFNSYVLHKDNPEMISIWESIFFHMSTTETAIQLSLQSNLLAFYKNLSLPFVRDEYSKVKELYSEYISRRQSDDKASLVWFRQSYQSKSLWNRVTNEVFTDASRQNEVLKDFLHIVLHESICGEEYIEEIFWILMQIIDGDDQFENKLLIFMEKANIFVIMHRIFALYMESSIVKNLDWVFGISIEKDKREVQGKGTAAKEEKKERKRKESESEESEESEEEKEHEDHKLIENEEGKEIKTSGRFAESEEESSNDSNSSGHEDSSEQPPGYKSVLSRVFSQIIEDITSSPAHSISVNQPKFSKCIQDLDSYLELITASQEFSLANQKKLEFWLRISRIPKIPKLLQKLSTKLIQQPEKYLTNPEFSHMLLNELSDIHVSSINEIPIKKFKIFYYNELLSNGEDCIGLIIKEINTSDSWKYSGMVIETIIEKSELEEKINDMEDDIERVQEIDSPNEFLVKLDGELSESVIAENFGILLNDRICQTYEEKELDERKLPLMLRTYTWMMNASQVFMKNIMALVATARIRRILDWYCDIISNIDGPRSAVVEDSFRAITEFLNGEHELLQLYCYKKIIQIKQFKIIKLIRFLRPMRITWMRSINEINFGNELPVFAFTEGIQEEYRELAIFLEGIKEDISSLDQRLMDIRSSKDRLILGLVFLNNVYLRYSKPDFNPTAFIEWYQQKQELLITRLGIEFAAVIRSFIFNFREDSFMRVDPTKKGRSIVEIQSIAFIITLVLAFGAETNPISSVFFSETGIIPQNFSHKISQSYCIGAEPLKIHDYLLFIKRNFDSLRSSTYSSHRYAKGSANRCSDNCDYLYIIDRCGGATEVKPCPFCGREIGGHGHNLVQRPGHVNLSDQEAKLFLDQKIDYYNQNDPPGFRINSNTPLTGCRSMKHKLSFNFSNLITSSVFYFLTESDLVPEEQLLDLFRCSNQEQRELLKRNIFQNFAEIYSMISAVEPELWVLSSVSQLHKLLKAYKHGAQKKNHRDNFEVLIEDEILIKTSQLESINSYKQLLNAYVKPNDLVEYIEELKVPQEDQYKHVRLFRIIDTPSFESMTKAFNLCNRKTELKVLSIFIENYQEIKNLKYFYPIINLSNYLVEKFSFVISRKESSMKSLKILMNNDGSFVSLFENFSRCWKKITIPLINDCKSFDKQELTAEDPLSFFLLDESLNGDGKYITAALKSLANIQNRILSMCSEEQTKDQNSHPIQYLKESDIIELSLSKSELTSQCSIASLGYSLGKEIIFDFDRIQLNLLGDLRNKKHLDTDNLNLMQYQFELLNTRGRNAGVISEIRGKIPQGNLEEEFLAKIEKELKLAEKKFEKKNIYREIYGLLDKILCETRNLLEEGDVCIGSVMKKMKHRVNWLSDIHVIENIELRYVVSLYEYIELKCFPIIIEYIGIEYQLELEIEEVLLVNSMVDNLPREVTVELHKTIQRIILRLLTAAIDPDSFIRDFIQNESFWNSKYLAQIETIVELFPEEIKLSKTIELERVLMKSLYEDKVEEHKTIEKIKEKKAKKQIKPSGKKARS